MKQGIFFTILSLTFCFSNVEGQLYKDYIGAGHSQGIIVMTSDNMMGSEGVKTLDGSGMDNPMMEASRFLAQATLGYRPTDIEAVKNLGFEAWIDDQFLEPTTLLLPEMNSIWYDLKVAYANAGIDTSDVFGPYALHYNYALWTVNMSNEDLLRHRITEALTEVLVVSMNSDLRDWGEALCDYYDMLSENAFGNYHDILSEVSKSVQMGYYLSHLNNPKTDTTNNIRPDENYAREIMQLFSIGLYELNQDGTPKRDANGNQIPTYDNLDIKEMAKVFTGLGAGAILDPNNWPYVPIFGLGTWAIDKTVPMQIFNSEHEPGPKVILKDITINIPNDGMAEVDSAISYLFHHNNVGPFLSYRLIQRLVKSNPTPAYVSRVAAAFNDNGSGVRGDMKAVIKAILLDSEARSGVMMRDITSGQLRAPFLRTMQFMRSQTINTTSGYLLNNGYTEIESTQHWPLAAPSVFNFYLPNFVPKGGFEQEGLVGPEFKIHNTSTSINYVNRAHAWTYWDAPWWDYEDNLIWPDTTSINTDYLYSLTDDPEKMINVLDLYLTHGQLSEITRENMRTAMDQLYWTWNEEWRWHRTRMLLYLFLISPDYVTLK